MRKLTDCENYIGSSHFDSEIKKAPQNKQELDDVIKSGLIPLDMLTDHIEKIRKNTILNSGLKLLNDKNIVLLNPMIKNDEFLLGARIPFFVVGGNTMYVNMTRFGKWMEERQGYSISPISELSPIIQSSYLTYRFIQNSDKLLNDPKIRELITRIYVDMFVQLLKSFGINLSDVAQDDNTTYIRYLAGKFFMKYVLDEKQTDSIDNLAFKVAKTSATSKISLDILQMREDGDGFIMNNSYDTLYGFLTNIMDATRSNIKISSALVLSKYSFLYGEMAYHSITYLPYLLFFLFLSTKGAPLRKLRDKITSMRAVNSYINMLEKEILAKTGG